MSVMGTSSGNLVAKFLIPISSLLTGDECTVQDSFLFSEKNLDLILIALWLGVLPYVSKVYSFTNVLLLIILSMICS